MESLRDFAEEDSGDEDEEDDARRSRKAASYLEIISAHLRLQHDACATAAPLLYRNGSNETVNEALMRWNNGATVHTAQGGVSPCTLI